jgi:hypothetical protein
MSLMKYSSVKNLDGYGLGDRRSIPGRGRDFSLRHHGVRTGSVVQPASCPTSIGNTFLEGKATEAAK